MIPDELNVDADFLSPELFWDYVISADPCESEPPVPSAFLPSGPLANSPTEDQYRRALYSLIFVEVVSGLRSDAESLPSHALHQCTLNVSGGSDSATKTTSISISTSRWYESSMSFPHVFLLFPTSVTSKRVPNKSPRMWVHVKWGEAGNRQEGGARLTGSVSLSRYEELRKLCTSGKWYLVPLTPCMVVDRMLTAVCEMSSLHPGLALAIRGRFDHPSVPPPNRSPVTCDAIENAMIDICRATRRPLHTAQQTAIIASAGQSGITLVQGPPGTGKTEVIAVLVAAYVKVYQDAFGRPPSVLLTSASNVAIDNVGVRLLQLSEAMTELRVEAELVRSHAKEVVVPHAMQPYTVDALGGPRAMRSRDGARRILLSTLSHAGSSLLLNRQYDLVVIDEAGQATESHVLIPLRQTQPNAVVVMVGDHKQLPPLTRSRFADTFNMTRSCFERLAEAAPHRVVLLDKQHRMHPQIAAFPSLQFYGGLLRSHASLSETRLLPHHHYGAMMGARWYGPLSFYDTAGLALSDDGAEFQAEPPATVGAGGAGRGGGGRQERRNGDAMHSIANDAEASVVAAVVDMVCRSGPRPTPPRPDAQTPLLSVGIISFYAAQVDTLARVLRGSRSSGLLWGADVEVNTVDGYQGREKGFIVVSCVRSGGAVGFLRDPRRLNVALTRAQYGCLIVGDSRTLRGEPLWRALLAFMTARRLVVPLAALVERARQLVAPGGPQAVARDITAAVAHRGAAPPDAAASAAALAPYAPVVAAALRGAHPVTRVMSVLEDMDNAMAARGLPLFTAGIHATAAAEAYAVVETPPDGATGPQGPQGRAPPAPHDATSHTNPPAPRSAPSTPPAPSYSRPSVARTATPAPMPIVPPATDAADAHALVVGADSVAASRASTPTATAPSAALVPPTESAVQARAPPSLPLAPTPTAAPAATPSLTPSATVTGASDTATSDAIARRAQKRPRGGAAESDDSDYGVDSHCDEVVGGDVDAPLQAAPLASSSQPEQAPALAPTTVPEQPCGIPDAPATAATTAPARGPAVGGADALPPSPTSTPADLPAGVAGGDDDMGHGIGDTKGSVVSEGDADMYAPRIGAAAEPLPAGAESALAPHTAHSPAEGGVGVDAPPPSPGDTATAGVFPPVTTDDPTPATAAVGAAQPAGEPTPEAPPAAGAVAGVLTMDLPAPPVPRPDAGEPAGDSAVSPAEAAAKGRAVDGDAVSGGGPSSDAPPARKRPPRTVRFDTSVRVGEFDPDDLMSPITPGMAADVNFTCRAVTYLTRSQQHQLQLEQAQEQHRQQQMLLLQQHASSPVAPPPLPFPAAPPAMTPRQPPVSPTSAGPPPLYPAPPPAKRAKEPKRPTTPPLPGQVGPTPPLPTAAAAPPTLPKAAPPPMAAGRPAGGGPYSTTATAFGGGDIGAHYAALTPFFDPYALAFPRGAVTDAKIVGSLTPVAAAGQGGAGLAASCVTVLPPSVQPSAARFAFLVDSGWHDVPALLLLPLTRGGEVRVYAPVANARPLPALGRAVVVETVTVPGPARRYAAVWWLLGLTAAVATATAAAKAGVKGFPERPPRAADLPVPPREFVDSIPHAAALAARPVPHGAKRLAVPPQYAARLLAAADADAMRIALDAAVASIVTRTARAQAAAATSSGSPRAAASPPAAAGAATLRAATTTERPTAAVGDLLTFVRPAGLTVPPLGLTDSPGAGLPRSIWRGVAAASGRRSPPPPPTAEPVSSDSESPRASPQREPRNGAVGAAISLAFARAAASAAASKPMVSDAPPRPQAPTTALPAAERIIAGALGSATAAGGAAYPLPQRARSVGMSASRGTYAASAFAAFFAPRPAAAATAAATVVPETTPAATSAPDVAVTAASPADRKNAATSPSRIAAVADPQAAPTGRGLGALQGGRSGGTDHAAAPLAPSVPPRAPPLTRAAAAPADTPALQAPSVPIEPVAPTAPTAPAAAPRAAAPPPAAAPAPLPLAPNATPARGTPLSSDSATPRRYAPSESPALAPASTPRAPTMSAIAASATFLSAPAPAAAVPPRPRPLGAPRHLVVADSVTDAPLGAPTSTGDASSLAPLMPLDSMSTQLFDSQSPPSSRSQELSTALRPPSPLTATATLVDASPQATPPAAVAPVITPWRDVLGRVGTDATTIPVVGVAPRTPPSPPALALVATVGSDNSYGETRPARVDVWRSSLRGTSLALGGAAPSHAPSRPQAPLFSLRTASSAAATIPFQSVAVSSAAPPPLVSASVHGHPSPLHGRVDADAGVVRLRTSALAPAFGLQSQPSADGGSRPAVKVFRRGLAPIPDAPDDLHMSPTVSTRPSTVSQIPRAAQRGMQREAGTPVYVLDTESD